MEYEIIDAGPCRKRLLLKFSAEDIDAAFDETYREINGYVQIKGFRKGKAPRHALEKRFGKEAAGTAKQELTEKNLADVIEKEKLQVIGSVIDKNKDAMPAPGEPFQVEIEMDVAPDFELPEYKGVLIESVPVEVTDARVDEAIDRYRAAFTTFTPTEEAAKEGDVVILDFTSRVDGQEIISMQDQKLRVEGEIIFDLPYPELVSTFVGAKAGDVKTFTLTLPEDHTSDELRGKPADFEATIKAVEAAQVPEMNDAFAEGLGMGTLDDLRERVRRNLAHEAMVDASLKEEDLLVDTLLAGLDFEVPQAMVEGETDALLEQRLNQLARSGAVPGDALQKQVESYRPEAREMAIRQVRWGILARKIADKEEITVTPEDLNQQIESLAASYRTTPAKMLKHIRNAGGVEPMVDQVRFMKVVKFLRDNAKKPEDGDTGSINAAAAESVGVQAGEGEEPGEGQ